MILAHKLALCCACTLSLACRQVGPVPAQVDAPSTLVDDSHDWKQAPHDVRCEEPHCAGVDLDVLDRQYAVFAWQTFVAINHPDNESCPGTHWNQWWDPQHENCSGETRLDDLDYVEVDTECSNEVDHGRFRELSWFASNIAKTSDRPPRHSPIKIANGPVSFTVRLNRVSQLHICGRRLLGAAQQLKAAVDDRLGNPSWGTNHREYDPKPYAGPIHLKFAWVDISNFPEQRQQRYIRVKHGDSVLGAVAIHLVAKTRSTGNYWVWSTFEHDDNFEIGDPPDGTDWHPLFRDPNCRTQDCGYPNTCARPGFTTQISPVEVDYDGAERYHVIVAEVNRETRQALREQSALEFLSHYSLRGVQRPLAPTNKSGSSAWPPVLSSPIIEWNHQDSSCMGCHSHSTTWLPNDIKAYKQHCANGCAVKLDARCPGPDQCSWSTDEVLDADRCVKRQWSNVDSGDRSGHPRSDFFWGLDFAKKSPEFCNPPAAQPQATPTKAQP